MLNPDSRGIVSAGNSTAHQLLSAVEGIITSCGYFHKEAEKATRLGLLHQIPLPIRRAFSPDTSTDKTTIQKQCNTPCSII